LKTIQNDKALLKFQIQLQATKTWYNYYSHFKLQQTIPSLLRISTEQHENNKIIN